MRGGLNRRSTVVLNCKAHAHRATVRPRPVGIGHIEAHDPEVGRCERASALRGEARALPPRDVRGRGSVRKGHAIDQGILQAGDVDVEGAGHEVFTTSLEKKKT